MFKYCQYLIVTTPSYRVYMNISYKWWKGYSLLRPLKDNADTDEAKKIHLRPMLSPGDTYVMPKQLKKKDQSNSRLQGSVLASQLPPKWETNQHHFILYKRAYAAYGPFLKPSMQCHGVIMNTIKDSLKELSAQYNKNAAMTSPEHYTYCWKGTSQNVHLA